MIESEAELRGKFAKSRGLGIHITGPRESPRQVKVEEAHVEPEQVA